MKARVRKYWPWVCLVFILSVPVLGQVIPSPGGVGASLSGNNAWTGTNTFTTPLKVFPTTNHAGTDSVQLSYSGTTGSVTVNSGNLKFGINGFHTTFTADDSMLGIGLPDSPTRGGFGFIAGPSTTTNTVFLGLASGSRTLHVMETGDRAVNVDNGVCGTAACTNPTILSFAAAPTSANSTGRAYYGDNGKGMVKTLTEATATATVRIPVASGAATGGMYYYQVFATDATPTPQMTGGFVRFNVVNIAGTETCLFTDTQTENTPGADTLTATIGCSTTPTNAVDITINATSSLTQTTLESYSRVVMAGPGEPAPQ